MTTDSRLDDLMMRWEETRAEDGRDLSAEELCADCPELLEEMRGRIRALRRVDRLLADADGADAFASLGPGEGAEAGRPLPTVPGYEIRGELGRGGMGVVYEAWQTKLNRPVALKMILAGGHAGPRERQRFRTEAEAVARLQHPNVVQIYDVGEHDGRPFLALEYVAGGSLARRLREEPLSVREAAALIETLAYAVRYAHEQGVVHRDLKPANVLLQSGSSPQRREEHQEDQSLCSSRLCGEFTPKITDFGLAKILEGGPGPTATSDVLGTPSYMAPEQAAGRSRAISPATDVYALGAILYELLAGRPPFRAETPLETLNQVLRVEPVSLHRLRSSVPRDLETICLKCLEKEPGKRYASAAALAEDLRRFLNGEAIRARPTRPWEKAWKWARRRPAWAALLLVSTLAVLGFSVGAVLHAVQLRAALSKAEALERRTGEFLYASDMRLAQQLWQLGDLHRLRELLDRHRLTPGRDDHRGFEWHYLDRLGRGTEEATLHGHEGEVYVTAFSPDGQTLATAGQDGTVRLWRTDTWQERAVLRGHEGGVFWLAFAVDGTLWTAGQDRTLRRWSGRGAPTTLPFPDVPLRLALAPDGRVLAVALPSREIHLLDLPAGKARARIAYYNDRFNDATRIEALAFSRDGKSLAVASDRGSVTVWDARTGQGQGFTGTREGGIPQVAFTRSGSLVYNDPRRGLVVCPVPFANTPSDQVSPWPAFPSRSAWLSLCCLALSPDDRLAAGGGGDGTIPLMELTGKKSGVILKGHGDRVNSVVFSPDGRRLVSASRDGTVKVWDPVIRPSTGGLQGVAWAGGPIAFAADGQVLVVAGRDRRIQLLDPHTGRLIGQLGRHPWEIRQLAAAPAGGMLAVAGGRAIRVWDLAGSRELVSIDDLPGPVQSLSFSGDGKVLASGGEDHRVRFWDPVTGRQSRPPLPDQGAAILHLAFAPDGQSLVLATAAKAVKLWDLVRGKERYVKLLPEAATDLACAPDGHTFAVIGGFGTWLFDVIRGEPRGTVGGGGHLAYAPDGKSLFTTGRNGGNIDQWNLALKSHECGFQAAPGGSARLVLARDGRTLALAAGGAVTILDAANFHLTVPQGQLAHPVHRLAFSPDSGTLLTAGRATERIASLPKVPLKVGAFRLASYKAHRAFTRNVQETIQRWDVLSRQPLPSALLDKTVHAVNAAALSLDGLTLAGGTGHGMVGLWDLATGENKGTFHLGPDAHFRSEHERLIVRHGLPDNIRANAWRVLDLAFSPDGRFLAASCEAGEVKVFDPANGRELARLEAGPGPVPCLAFSPDSTLLATAGGDQVRLWEAGTDRLVRAFPSHHEPVQALAFAPDGRRLATGSQDCRIRVWEVHGDAKPVILPGHLDPVTALAFSPDGRTLASASWDRTVRLWHLRTAQELLRLEGHGGKVHAVAFAPDGNTLASGGESADGKGEVFLWRAGPVRSGGQLP